MEVECLLMLKAQAAAPDQQVRDLLTGGREPDMMN